MGLNQPVLDPSGGSSLTQVLGLVHGSPSERNLERFSKDPQERGRGSHVRNHSYSERLEDFCAPVPRMIMSGWCVLPLGVNVQGQAR